MPDKKVPMTDCLSDMIFNGQFLSFIPVNITTTWLVYPICGSLRYQNGVGGQS